MKTMKFTKILLMSAGVFLAGAMQAQTPAAPATDDNPPMPSAKVLDDNAISGITNGMGSTQGKGGFWGYAFGDYAYVGSGDSAGRGTKQQYKGLGAQGQNSGQNAFEIRRAYLGYDITPNKKLSGCVLLAYEGDQDVNNNRMMYLKYAYIKIKNIWKGTDLKIGQQSTCSFASAYNTEPLCDYRSAEKTIMDIHAMDGSSDMGINLGGKIITFKSGDSTKFPAFIGYNLMVGNNSGNAIVPGFGGSTATSLPGSLSVSTVSIPTISWKTGKDTTISVTPTVGQSLNPFNNTTDNAKKFRMNLFGNLLNGQLTVGVYADYINYGNFYYKTAKGYQHSVMTEKAYAAFNSKWFGIGAEYVQQTYTNGEYEVITKGGVGTNDTTNAIQSGFSVFAHGTIIQNCLNIFVRYDAYTPDGQYQYNYNTTLKTVNTTYTSLFSNVSGSGNGNSFTESFINAGIDWSPWKDKKMHIMPNVWMYQIKNGYGSDNLAAGNYMLYRVTFLFAF
jgi:hypothetical protein